MIIGKSSLQISAKTVENSPETNSKYALYSLKFSFRDIKENILWGVLRVYRDNYTKRLKIIDPLIDQVKAHFTLKIELISITKRALMLFLAGNILNFAAGATRLARK